MSDNPTQLLKEMACRCSDAAFFIRDTEVVGVQERCLRCRCLAAVEEMGQRLNRVEMKLTQKEEFITTGQVELMKAVNEAVDKSREWMQRAETAEKRLAAAVGALEQLRERLIELGRYPHIPPLVGECASIVGLALAGGKEVPNA